MPSGIRKNVLHAILVVVVMLEQAGATLAADCNGNDQEDGLDLDLGVSLDCNENGIPDECDLAEGTSVDGDGGGIPDECEHFVFEFVRAPPERRASVPGQLTVDALLYTRGLDPGTRGAQGWQIVGATRGCSLVAATIEGSNRDDFDNPRVPAFQHTQINDDLYVELNPGAEPVDGIFMSAVILSLKGSTWLEPAESPHVVARITIESEGEDCSECEVVYPDVRHVNGYPQDSNTVFYPGEVPAPTFGTIVSFCGRQLRGDCNQDGSLDISDGICLLGHLFQHEPATLPCEGGTRDAAGNALLLDTNNDDSVDLSDAIAVFIHLFLSRLEGMLGDECVPIPGCPDSTRCPPPRPVNG